MDPSASLLSAAFQILVVLIIPLVGGISAFVPYLMPKRECFAVTVPDNAQSDPALRQYKRRYACIILGITAAFTILSIVCSQVSAPASAAIVMAVGVIVLMIATYTLMLYFRAKVQKLKRARKWDSTSACSAAPMGFGEAPKALSLKWDLVFIPFVLVCLFICWAGYGNIPEEIPRQIAMDGQITTYFSKSPLVACFPALVVAFIDAILTFSHWSMLRSKKFTDPACPAQTAWAYAMFVRAESILMVASGVLCGGVGIAIALSFVKVISIGQSAILCLAFVMIIAVASVAVSLVYGQNGSRLIARVSSTRDDQKLLRDNDRFWKLGIFYFNPEDPALFLPERFGIGWTFNWGRPSAWIILGALIAFIVGFLVLVALLA